jgi:hypothetical protein
MIELNKAQARAAIAAMEPRYQALRDLLSNPMLQLPDGLVAWDHAKTQLELHRTAILALQNIAVGQ